MESGGFAEEVTHKGGKIELRGNVTIYGDNVTTGSAASSETFRIENVRQTEVGLR